MSGLGRSSKSHCGGAGGGPSWSSDPSCKFRSSSGEGNSLALGPCNVATISPIRFEGAPPYLPPEPSRGPACTSTQAEGPHACEVGWRKPLPPEQMEALGQWLRPGLRHTAHAGLLRAKHQHPPQPWAGLFGEGALFLYPGPPLCPRTFCNQVLGWRFFTPEGPHQYQEEPSTQGDPSQDKCF